MAGYQGQNPVTENELFGEGRDCSTVLVSLVSLHLV